MATAAPPKMRPLMVLHLFGILGLVGWWGRYFWDHTPARQVYRLAAAKHASTDAFEVNLDPLFTALRVAIGDIALGLALVALVAIGTRVYMRRLQIWIDARTSGQAVTFGGEDLETKALSANAKRIQQP